MGILHQVMPDPLVVLVNEGIAVNAHRGDDDISAADGILNLMSQPLKVHALRGSEAYRKALKTQVPDLGDDDLCLVIIDQGADSDIFHIEIFLLESGFANDDSLYHFMRRASTLKRGIFANIFIAWRGRIMVKYWYVCNEGGIPDDL
jgi:hypothetical protein